MNMEGVLLTVHVVSAIPRAYSAIPRAYSAIAPIAPAS